MSEQTEEEYLIERLSKLLAEISVIVNGPQPMGVLWSYADLPEKVQALKGAAALNAQLPVRAVEYGSREHADKLSAEIDELRETLKKANDAYAQGVTAGRSEALNAQAGVVEALRPLEVELEKLDDATERDSTPEMVGATWRLIEAARAALAAVKGVDRG
ncbi:MAG: hypothetical protein ACK5X3_09165 [Pseudomonadota bacterium]